MRSPLGNWEFFPKTVAGNIEYRMMQNQYFMWSYHGALGVLDYEHTRYSIRNAPYCICKRKRSGPVINEQRVFCSASPDVVLREENVT